MLKHVGPVNAKKLIEVFGSPEAVFKESQNLLSKLKLNSRILSQIRSSESIKLAEKELKFIEKHNLNVLVWTQDDYPYRLKQCFDAPLVIYLKGNVDLNKEKSVSIVGTRRATAYGKKVCDEVIEEIKDLDVQIVSGLALGIDTASHQSALKQGLSTVAVLGHGLNRLYPHQNKKLAEEISNNGCLMTEFASSAEFLPGNFPSRNRIIAGLSDLTLVIESNKKGGSIITAEIANSYNRDVMAIPGRTDAEFSSGCNWLIKKNKAALVENGDDIIQLMQWNRPIKKSKQQKLFIELSSQEDQVVEILKKKGAVRIDEISSFTGNSLNNSATLLLELEFKNVVKSLPGKMYALNN